MAKPRATVDDAIVSMGRDRVRDADRDKSDGSLPERPPDEILVPSAPPEGETVANLFSHIPAGEGYYIKLYKRFPVPKEYGNNPVFLLDFEQPELLKDIESEVLKAAIARGWTDGIYEAKLIKQNTPGIIAAQRITLSVPPPPAVTATHPQNGNAPQSDPTALLLKAVEIVKSMQPPPAPATPPTPDITPVFKAVAEIYKTGRDSAAPTTTPVAQAPQPSIVELAKAIKELTPAPAPPPAAPDPLAVLERVGGLLKTMAPPAPRDTTPAVDPIEMAIRLKELFTPPPSAPQPDNTDRMITLITTLAPLIHESGGGGGGGEPVSPAIELIRALAPQAGKIWGDTARMVSAIVAYKSGAAVPPPQAQQPPRATVQPPPRAPMEGFPPSFTPPPLPAETSPSPSPLSETSPVEAQEPLGPEATAPPPPPPPAPVVEHIPVTEPGAEPVMQAEVVKEEAMLPVFQAIRNAAEANDRAFYPQLEELLARITTPEQFEQILAGQIPPDDVLGTVQRWGGNFFGTATAKAYFKGFLGWAAEQQQNLIMARCSQCGTDWTFRSEGELAENPHCADDGQLLERVP